jgi:hypothetical protein
MTVQSRDEFLDWMVNLEARAHAAVGDPPHPGPDLAALSRRMREIESEASIDSENRKLRAENRACFYLLLFAEAVIFGLTLAVTYLAHLLNTRSL